MREFVTFCVAISASMLLAACEGPEEADLILHNGKIVTVDSDFSIAEAIVVRDGLVVATGGADLLSQFRAAETIDLEGQTLMPGFIDSHTHIRGASRRHVDLAGTSSIGEIQALISARASELGEGEWITGYGWSEDELAELRRPLRHDLDEAAPANPVIMTRAGGHSAVANSMALEIAGITPDTPQPASGVIELDADGELNGIIRERQDIVGSFVPETEPADIRDSLVAALEDQFRLGITSFVQATGSAQSYRNWQAIYETRRGSLPRASVQVFWGGEEAVAAFREEVGFGDEHLRVGAIKIFADGGFTGPAAYTLEPYVGQGDYRGYLEMPEENLRALIRDVHDAGWQMGIHAIGDAAIVLTAQFLAEAIDATPREDHRHYLNHFSMRPPDDTMALMAAHDIMITQQPNFTYTLEGRYAANLDGWRLQHNNPLRSAMDHGIFLAISSDILPIGPMVGLYGAVTRRGMSGEVYGPDEAITIEEAVRAYTANGAVLTFEEDIKGTLEPGMLADMIVLSEDILTIDPNRIMEVQVEQTWLGGRLVYERGD